MNNAYCRLISVLLAVIFILGILPLVAMAVHKEATADSMDLCFTITKSELAETVMDWGFEGFALIISACGALLRQLFRLRNG